MIRQTLLTTGAVVTDVMVHLQDSIGGLEIEAGVRVEDVFTGLHLQAAMVLAEQYVGAAMDFLMPRSWCLPLILPLETFSPSMSETSGLTATMANARSICCFKTGVKRDSFDSTSRAAGKNYTL